MGQKTNSNLLRLGIANNEWKTKYYLQTLEESSLTTFKNFQLQIYVKQFLQNYGLFFHDYKFYYNTFTLHLYISYSNGLKAFTQINKVTKSNNLQFRKNKHISKKQFLKTKLKPSCNNFTKSKEQYCRKFSVKQYKAYILKKKFSSLKNLKNNNFIEKFSESLKLFFGNKYTIYITLQNLNSNLAINLTKNEQKLWKRKLLILKKYSTHNFFKETLNILFIATKVRNSSQIFADFISKQLMLLKRQSYFLIFIKRTLNLFITAKLTNIYGIKLIINGKFNNAPRARTNIIIAGNIPNQTLNNDINYYQSVAFSANGTFGVKAWIYEQKIKAIMFLQPKKIKYKKVRKSRLKKYTHKTNKLTFGTIGLKSCESGLISAKQLEAARQAIVRKTKRNGKLWIRIFPDLPITKKPIEVRMGKGKGSISHWCAKIRGGTILFELCGIENSIALNAFKTGSAKLPVKTKVFY